MLSNFKEIVKEKESDIFLTVTIVLVALFSFGVGLLVDLKGDSNSIVIQNPTPVASIQKALVEEKEEKTPEKGSFVGSVNSSKYHHPDCPWAKKISEENRVWFSSENDAQDAGYVPCGNFGKYNN